MNRLLFFITVLSFMICQNPILAQVKPAIATDAAIEKKIDAIMQKMTLDEKIGQMCEITIDVLTDYKSATPLKFSKAVLDTVIGKYKVGSILNVPLNVAQKKEVWADVIRQIQDKSMK